MIMIIQNGKSIGKNPQYNYILQPCQDCGIERWVVYLNGKPRTNMCRACAIKRAIESNKGRTQPESQVRKRQETRLRNHPIILTPCANCGVENYRTPKRRKEHNYCSAQCQMKYEYKNGIRDPYKITMKSHDATRESVNDGSHPFQQPENHVKAMRELGSKNYGRTWLEEKMGWALTKLGVMFESQYPIKYGLDILNRPRYYFPDFAIPERNLLIECDGSYWHKNKKRENLRESRLKELGWNVIRFSDSEIKSDLMGCADKVCRWFGAD